MEFANLYQMFLSQAQNRRRKRFIFFEDKCYTYGETAKAVNQAARAFSSRGVEKGTKVLLMMNNSPEFLFAVLGLFACGAVVIPVNVFFKETEAAYIAQDSEAEFIVSSRAFKEVAEGVRSRCNSVRGILSFDGGIDGCADLESEARLFSGEPLESPSEARDIAVFIYTSGTTGHPKGAMLTHANILANLKSSYEILGPSSKDRFLVMLPMFHTYTFTTCLMLPIYLGASIIILSSVMDMKKKSFKKILVFQRPTFVLGVPQVYAALAKAPMPKWFIKLLYPVKRHISGGAPLPMEIFVRFEKKFGKPVIEGYGLSEASPVAAFNPLDKQKSGTVGIAVPGVAIKIVDNDEMEVPRDEVGELIIKGPNVMQGYWKMPNATDEAIRNGWLFTGDLASMDEEGYITIVDRKKDLILAKGMNVYPREVEEVIYKFPGVEAAAVIGVPSGELGETIAAYIQPKAGEEIDEKKLRDYLKEELANFKLPKIIKIIDNIPLTATGKVLKKELKAKVKDGLI